MPGGRSRTGPRVMQMLRSLNLPRNPSFSRVRFTVTLVLCTLVVLSTIATWWIENQLSGPVVEWARLRATNMATSAVHAAIREVLAGGAGELDVFVRTAPDAGGAPLIRYDMGRVNQVMSDAADAILEEFRLQEPQEFHIPLGELTGLRVLAGWGPMVPIRIFATGSVVLEPRVEFVSAGINQVAHRLSMDVNVTMVVLAPFLRDRIVVRHTVPLADDVLPGAVPETYVNLVGFSGSLHEAALVLEAIDRGAAGAR